MPERGVQGVSSGRMEFHLAILVYPAPAVPEAATLEKAGGEAELLSLLSIGEKKGGTKHSELSFALGNFLLRADRPKEAIPHYRQALKQISNSLRSELRCNLAAALFQLGNLDEASVELKQAILERGSLAYASYYLAAISAKKGEFQNAYQTIYPRRNLPELGFSGILLCAQLAEALQLEAEAREHYLDVLNIEPHEPIAEERLSLLGAKKGASLLARGELEQAFSLWSETYQRCGEVFSAGYESGRILSSATKSFLDDDGLGSALRDFDKRFKQGLRGAELFYPLTLGFFFSIGRVHALFEQFTTLEEQRSFWKSRSYQEANYPYGRYRLAVINLYLGELEEALSELRFAADHLPASKKRPLKIEQIMKFVSLLSERFAALVDNRSVTYAEDNWSKAGFDDRFALNAWKASGLAPEQAAKWRTSGFTPTQARQWGRSGIQPEVASSWQDAGFIAPEEIRQWQRAGVEPEEALSWSGVFSGDVEKAIEFHKADFKNAELAERWSRVFLFAWEAKKWEELGFSPADAAICLAEGVSDPFRASEIRKGKSRLASSDKKLCSELAEDTNQE